MSIRDAVSDILHDITSVYAHLYSIGTPDGVKNIWTLPVEQVHRDLWQEYGWREWPKLEMFERDLKAVGFRVVNGHRVGRVGCLERIVIL